METGQHEPGMALFLYFTTHFADLHHTWTQAMGLLTLIAMDIIMTAKMTL